MGLATLLMINNTIHESTGTQKQQRRNNSIQTQLLQVSYDHVQNIYAKWKHVALRQHWHHLLF